MTILRVCLLGAPEIQYDGEPVDITSVKTQALLYYLIATRQPHTRDKLATLLWEDAPERQARGSLRNTVYNLRRALEPVDPIIAENLTVRFNTDIDYWLDVEAFEGAVTQVIDRRGNVVADSLETLRAAINLYRGEFLDGFSVGDSYGFDDWVLFERDRLGRLYVTALRALSEGYEVRGEYRSAIRYARAMLDYDPLQESVHRWLMHLYHAAGDRAAALRQYETVCDLLRRELGAEPLQETQELHKQILQGPAGSRTTVEPVSMPASLPPLPRPRFKARPVPEYLKSPLVGREGERARLEALLDATRQGSGQLVLIHGEVGVGKTRLVQEVIEAAQDTHLLVGHAYEAESAPPYQPLIEALRSAAPVVDALDPPVAPLWLHEVVRLVPELGGRLQEPNGALPLDAEQARSRLFEGVARLIGRLAETRPVILALDDLHWADDATLDLLGYLVRAIAYQPVLVIGTYRTEEAGSMLQRLIRDLRRAGLVTQIEVSRLDVTQVTEMIRQMAGMAEGAERFSRRIYERTAGNPFYVIEVIRSLFEQGVLRQESGGWATTWEDFASDYRTLPLPTSVREVVEARLERLGHQPRTVLEAAAVIRHPFSFSTVRAASGLPEAEALDAFDALLRASLIHEIAVDLEGSTYDFFHPLIREVAYQGLSGARRQYLHCRVGQALEEVYAGCIDGVVERLAYHFAKGGARSKALHYAIAAGDRARAIHAPETAIEHYQRALALGPDPVQQVAIHTGLGDVYTLCGRHSAAVAAYEAALALANDPQPVADLHRRIGRVCERGGDYAVALRHFESGKAALASVGPCKTLALLDDGIALIHFRQGQHEAAIERCEQALTALKGLDNGDTRLETAWLTNTLGSAYLARGDYTAALDHFRRSLALRQDLNDLEGMATLHNNIGVVHYYRGDYEAAHECYQRSLTIKQEIGDIYGLAVSHTNLGLTSFRLGDMDAAHRHLMQALKLCHDIEAEGLLPEAYRILAELHLAAADVAGAAKYGQAALAAAQKINSQTFIGVAYRVLGEVAAAQDEPRMAQQHFEESLQVLEALGERHEWAKTAQAYGRILAAWGRTGKARDWLRQAAEIFRTSGATYRLDQVEETLKSL